MLTGINPLLTGRLLRRLDDLGHSDTVAVVDANFPAHRFAAPCIEVPGIDVGAMTRAVCEVLPLDPERPPVLMDSGEPELTEVQRELALAVAGGGLPALVERWAFYDLVDGARLVIATGELRLWGNVLLAKGIPIHPLPSHPVPSHPVPIHPVPIHPVPTRPLPTRPLPPAPAPADDRRTSRA